MKHFGLWLLALPLLSGCGSAIAPNQADGKDCNYSVLEIACGTASYCDPGVASANGEYPRTRKYGITNDKSHVVGTCRPKVAVGAACVGNVQCTSGKCLHKTAGNDGICE